MHTDKRALIVDDSEAVLTLLESILCVKGFACVRASDGVEGLEAARAQPFDLIVTDIDMPRMDGFAMCAALKADPATKGTPVVVLSGLTGAGSIEQGFLSGACAYIKKNSSREFISRRIDEVMDSLHVFHDKLVLVVDDSPAICMVLEEGLMQAGFQVLTAGNGRIAMDILEHVVPDIIVSDLHMPEIDGFALFDHVRQSSRLAHLPFVTMSSAGDRAAMRRIMQGGGAAYLVKPFNVEQLVVTVEKILSDSYRWLLRESEQLGKERDILLSGIACLVQALEARDQYTRGHSENVARLSRGIGATMALSSADLNRLELAARLHDLGKIGIPDSVLLKPAKLTTEEFAIIKRHPQVGVDILKPVASLADIIPAVASHHERLDGSGYPAGLSGTDIPLWARIIATADVFDALTSRRPYRLPVGRAKALETIQGMVPHHLCPVCVQALLDFLENTAN